MNKVLADTGYVLKFTSHSKLCHHLSSPEQAHTVCGICLTLIYLKWAYKPKLLTAFLYQTPLKKKPAFPKGQLPSDQRVIPTNTAVGVP